MKTGVIFGYPGKNVNKSYMYHGVPDACNFQPDITPAHNHKHEVDEWFVFTLAPENITNNGATFKGRIQSLFGTFTYTWRGFEYGPVDSEEYLIVFEFGEFSDGVFSLYGDFTL